MPNLPRRQKTDPATPNKTTKGGTAVLPAIGRGLLILFLIGVIAGCIVACVLTVYLFDYIDTDESIDLNNIRLNYTTILYAMDENTNEYFELQRLHGDENRIWVDYEQMPKHLVEAVIALEDQRFESHQGVDWKRTIFAGVNMLNPFATRTQGGSTITQQLIKNVTGEDAPRVDRKVKEIFSALKLEKHNSKEQILEAYLNTIALGNNTNGVQAAANLYFNKDISELDLAECTALVSITQNPWKYDPLRRLENLQVRQKYTLKCMLEQNKITQEQHDAALAEELIIATDTADSKVNAVQNSWFVDQVFQDVVAALVEEKGYTEQYATQQLLRGGYRVYTTVDQEMQDFLEKKFNVESGSLPGVNNPEYPEGAFVVIDLNGQIKAVAGSDRTKEGSLLFSRARDAVRHPGSTIKPIASYAPAVEAGIINFSSRVEDGPITITENGVPREWPKNFYGSYMGTISVDYAVRRSTNTIPAKLQQALGVQNTFYFLRDKLGLDTLVEKRVINGKVLSDMNLAPMALGEMTDGVTPLGMAGAYQIFGNGGLYTKPYSFTKVLDSEGNIILENDPTPIRVISSETATIVNRLLQGVTRGAQGTGTTAPFSAMPVAGKTGTSDNDENQWFIGVTPYYVGVCWLGYDIPEQISYAGYGYGPPQIWKNIMGPIHQNLAIVQFAESNGVVTETFCVETGLLATEECAVTQVGWYKKSDIPEFCEGHDGNPDEENEDGEDMGDEEDTNKKDKNNSSSSRDNDDYDD